MALSSKDLRSNEELKADGLDERDIRMFRKIESAYYMLLVELDEAQEAKDFLRILDLEPQITQKEFLLLYQGKDPKTIPLQKIKELHGIDDLYERNSFQYIRRIKGPPSGIRAFCVKCCGGQTAEVRRCQAVNCPLWPFRMGTNPLSGKLMPPVEDVVLEDDDYVVADEDDDTEATE